MAGGVFWRNGRKRLRTIAWCHWATAVGTRVARFLEEPSVISITYYAYFTNCISESNLGRADFSQHITAESFIFSAGVSQALVSFRRKGALGDSPPEVIPIWESPSTPRLQNRNRLRIWLRNRIKTMTCTRSLARLLVILLKYAYKQVICNICTSILISEICIQIYNISECIFFLKYA